MSYYLIKDKNIVGKTDGHTYYLYDHEKGWIADCAHILMDRVIGYDGESIGCTSMLDRVEEISEQEALAMIHENFKGSTDPLFYPL